MARMPEIARNEENKDAYDYLHKTRGAVRGGFAITLASPDLTQRMAHVGTYVRFDSPLPKLFTELGYDKMPICMAKTQYSFSTDPNLRGAPSGHVVNVREVRLAAGAEFIVMICGDIMTMPGLPKIPSAEKIDLTEDGKVVGLF